MREKYQHWTPLEVRWGDMDAMGHVNNTAYLVYLETARIRFYETLGLDSPMQEDQLGVGLVSVTCNFRQIVCYLATLDIGSRVAKLGKRSFRIEQSIFLKDTDDLVADGIAVGVWVDYQQSKSLALPDWLRTRLEEHAQ